MQGGLQRRAKQQGSASEQTDKEEEKTTNGAIDAQFTNKGAINEPHAHRRVLARDTQLNEWVYSKGELTQD